MVITEGEFCGLVTWSGCLPCNPFLVNVTYIYFGAHCSKLWPQCKQCTSLPDLPVTCICSICNNSFSFYHLVSDSWSLFGEHFSQGYATAVTFSYVYHYSRLGSQRSSLLPTIQISSFGYQIFLYDCKHDVMLANNFFLVPGITDISVGFSPLPFVFSNHFAPKSCR